MEELERLKLIKDLYGNLDITYLKSNKSKHCYIRFISTLTQDIENLELELELTTKESLNKAIKGFETKWNFPIGQIKK
jgi:hypothetical protein